MTPDTFQLPNGNYYRSPPLPANFLPDDQPINGNVPSPLDFIPVEAAGSLAANGAKLLADEAGPQLARLFARGAAESAEVPATVRGLQTGAREIIPEVNNPEAWEKAEAAYGQTRLSNSDIGKISENTGMPQSDIAKIKDHIFHTDHNLDYGPGKFDADPEIANAWSRLIQGDHVESDIELLRHEMYEADYLANNPGATAREAHKAAIDAGHTWTPPRGRWNMLFHVIMMKVEETASAAKYRFTTDGVNFGILLMRKADGSSELIEPLVGDHRRDFFLRAAAKLKKEWRRGDIPDIAEWAS